MFKSGEKNIRRTNYHFNVFPFENCFLYRQKQIMRLARSGRIAFPIGNNNFFIVYKRAVINAELQTVDGKAMGLFLLYRPTA